MRQHANIMNIQDQLYDSIAKTKKLAGVKVEDINVLDKTGKSTRMIWVAHDFGFLGGSLGKCI